MIINNIITRVWYLVPMGGSLSQSETSEAHRRPELLASMISFRGKGRDCPSMAL